MSGDSWSGVPAELESQMRGLNATCEARYQRPETRDEPRRMVCCHNPADYVVTLITECGHPLREPVCATHHDVVESYWGAGQVVIACPTCKTRAVPTEMRCEPL